jgi:hypothetical protein
MRKDDQRQNIFVSRQNIEELAKAFAVSDAMEQFKSTDTSINPQSLITYITINRPKFMEAQDEQS